MAKDVELSSLDLRYEGYRMKNPGLEERLLVSIAQRGQAVSLCAQAATAQGAVCLAGTGRASRDHEPSADFQQQGLEHPGAGSVHRRTQREGPPECGGDSKRAFPQQVLGEHAPGTHL